MTSTIYAPTYEVPKPLTIETFEPLSDEVENVGRIYLNPSEELMDGQPYKTMKLSSLIDVFGDPTDVTPNVQKKFESGFDHFFVSIVPTQHGITAEIIIDPYFYEHRTGEWNYEGQGHMSWGYNARVKC